jgi:predicted ATP-dependent endonuclease of OLD family
LSFEKNQCLDFQREIAIIHKAIYIDNPFVIDILHGSETVTPSEQVLIDLINDQVNDNLMDEVIKSVLAKEKLSEIEQAMNSINNGKITISDGDYYLEEEGFRQPISLNNLSTGLKSFMILKMLIDKGAIAERDVVILDEPEIHLHPQWQIAYAELIVLLQKHFNLSIIVTTHSPYFLDAINLFSVKHGLQDKVNYYLSSMEENRVSIKRVNDNIDLIYEKMADPIQILETLRHELNNK